MIEKLEVKDLKESETQLLANAGRLRDRYLVHDAPRCCLDTSAKAEKLPAGHPMVNQHATNPKGCPFASTTPLKFAASNCHSSNISQTGRRVSLPTPPETTRQLDDETPQKLYRNRSVSPSPSFLRAVSKCPIRMLDERPPEEIVEYFESHKHEIPRSHEVCIKRYQSNAESIRRLDAKYGNLANMIQGLGIKHQPMLHEKEAERELGGQPKANDAIGEWAGQVPLNPKAQKPIADQEDNREEREGHFDRALREIRVGESPSRPWGIRVPDEGTAPNTASPNIDDSTSNRIKHSPHLCGENDAGLSPPNQAHAPKNQSSRMTFTGPVFIGYPPEEAAILFRHLKMADS